MVFFSAALSRTAAYLPIPDGERHQLMNSFIFRQALPTTRNEVSGGAPSRKIRTNLMLLAGGGFALEEKRLRHQAASKHGARTFAAVRGQEIGYLFFKILSASSTSETPPVSWARNLSSGCFVFWRQRVRIAGD